MKLEYTTETINRIDFGNFEDFVSEYFGISYQYACEEEVSNDSCKSYSVNGKLSEYDLRDIENKKFAYRASTLLNKFCADGLIPAGDYVIDVCW